MTNLVDGKTAVVTGAASGIGRGIATTLADHGADVVVADVRETPRGEGKPTHELIQAESDSRASFVQCDVRNRDQLVAAVDQAVELGGLDVMVNNAGIIGPQGSITGIESGEYNKIRRINLDGVFYGSQIAAERMTEGGGSIVNISSIAGIEGYGYMTPYSMSKGGVRMFTYALAAELGRSGIRANAIHPGIVESGITLEDSPIVGTDQEEEEKKKIPLGRFGQPEDVANAVLFLASDLADYVTASSLVVDGGLVNTR